MSEVIKHPHLHFETHHAENGETIICMQHDGACDLSVEISGADEQQAEILIKQSEVALKLLDDFFEGRFAELFRGLRIKIGDDLVKGGAEAISKDNLILGDRQKMLLSLDESEKLLSEYFDPGDRTKTMSPEKSDQPGSAWVYELIHETGHILEETTAH